MLFEVKVTGRRLSDNGDYALSTKAEAPTRDAACEKVLRDHDWEDAATMVVAAVPVLH